MSVQFHTQVLSSQHLSGCSEPVIGMIGTDFNKSSLKLRDAICFFPDSLQQLKANLPQSEIFEELIVMATCNRVEMYFVSSEPEKSAPLLVSMIAQHCGTSPDRISQGVTVRCGTDAVKHLFRVSAGLESMVLGESEIIGQVRKAYFKGFKQGNTASLLNRLFQQAIKTGKRVRSETALCTGEASVSSVALTHAYEVLGGLEDKKILLVGAGRMAQRFAERLHKQKTCDVVVCSRTEERAAVFAGHYQFSLLPFEELKSHLSRFDLIRLATNSEQPLIRASDRVFFSVDSNKKTLVVDIGAPRNAEPEITQFPGLHLVSIDNLKQTAERCMRQRKAHKYAAEAIIRQEVVEFHRWHNVRVQLQQHKQGIVVSA